MSTANNAAEHRTLVLARKEMMGWTQFQLEPSALRSPDPFHAPRSIGHNGAHLPAALFGLAKDAEREGRGTTAADIYQGVANRLTELCEDVRTLSVDEDKKRELYSIVLTDLLGSEHLASSLSDGTLRFFALAILAERLGRRHVSLDDHCAAYYEELHPVPGEAGRSYETGGVLGLLRYWAPFCLHAVKRMLEDYPECVIDFGACHSVFEDPTLAERLRTVLAPYPSVVLLLPSPDPDESIRILRKRNLAKEGITEAYVRMNEHFVRHPANREVAKLVVYTKDRSPEETCDDILAAPSMCRLEEGDSPGR